MKRIGLIGPGGISERALAPALNASTKACLWSVLSRDSERAADFASRHDAKAGNAAYDDLQAFLADPDLDAVMIASPDRLHMEQTIACANAGKHVICEKPLAASVDEVQKIIDACQAKATTLAVGYHLRWHAGHRQLHSLLQNGDLGEPRHCRVMWPTPANDATNWRAQPQVGRWWSLAAVGTHLLDFVRWMMVPRCGEVVDIQGLTANGVLGSQHDETAVVVLRFESGATAEICSSVLFAAPPRGELFTTTGQTVFDATFGAHGAGSITTPDGPFAFDVANPFVGEIDDFVDAIDSGREPEVGGTEAKANIAILEKF